MQEHLGLVPPRPGRTSYWHMRGSYLGIGTNRSTRSRDKATAREVLAARKAEIEAEVRAGRPGARHEPSFAEAVTRYLNDSGDERFMEPLIALVGPLPLGAVTGQIIEETAFELYPHASPATRNRQVFTPILAVLRHAGVAVIVKRPKGANGQRRDVWLKKEEAQKLIAAAWGHHPRFAAFLVFLLYTGCRLSEGLRLQVADVHLDEEEPFASLGLTKNGKARGVYLPPAVVTAIRLALAEPANATYARPRRPRAKGSVFCLTKSGALYTLLSEVEILADVAIPDGVSFHIFRHTYGAWCRRYGKLDRAGMVMTGAWASSEGAAAYDHIEISMAARAVDLFPGALEAAGAPLAAVGDSP